MRHLRMPILVRELLRRRVGAEINDASEGSGKIARGRWQEALARGGLGAVGGMRKRGGADDVRHPRTHGHTAPSAQLGRDEREHLAR